MSNSQNLVKITDENFEELINGEKPVLVDFYTDWCGPCKMLSPIIAALADDFKDKVVVGKLNAEENPQTSETYEVMSVPTVYLFKNGGAVEKSVGLISKDRLKDLIEKHL
ncbi:MAG: thioredoxin [Clostridiales bacterium]|jgi:thioredoxin 1|nr:thioredoxin [Clostridiales bacterium]